jgi:hypothetical protein
MTARRILALSSLAVAAVRLSFVSSPLDRYEGASAWTVGLQTTTFRVALLTVVFVAMRLVFVMGRRSRAAALAAAVLGFASLAFGVWGRHPLREAVPVGAWIREHTTPADAIVVFGSEPEIYVYAGRHAATGRLFMDRLVGDAPDARAKREKMFAEIEAARPTIAVTVNEPSSWRLPEGTVNPVLVWAEGYLAIDYEQVGLVEIGGGASPPLWGNDAAGTIPGTESFIVVYRKLQGRW